MSELRRERGWSVNEASRRLGRGVTYVRDLEAGKFLPKDEVLSDLAKLYGVSIRKLNDWLVADRLVTQTGEKAPGLSWFLRSLGDLSEADQRRIQRQLLTRLRERQERTDTWPDEFEIRERG